VTWEISASGAPLSVATPGMPASGTPVTNTTGHDVTVLLTAGLAAITAVAINGVVVTGLTIAISTLGPPLRLAAGAALTLTYTGSPTWQWVP
jgi:hypothetical protein